MIFDSLRWPASVARHDPAGRQAAKFRNGMAHRPLTIAEAIARLDAEIKAWTRVGKQWVIDPAEVRLASDLALNSNGRPRSNQKPPLDPGVAVYFTREGKSYALASDRWDRVADNIAAISATLEAMRGLERWGVGSAEQHLRGFALPPASLPVSRSWWQVLGVAEGAGYCEVRAAYRARAAAAHPDAGGDRAAWDEVQEAWSLAQAALGVNV